MTRVSQNSPSTTESETPNPCIPVSKHRLFVRNFFARSLFSKMLAHRSFTRLAKGSSQVANKASSHKKVVLTLFSVLQAVCVRGANHCICWTQGQSCKHIHQIPAHITYPCPGQIHCDFDSRRWSVYCADNREVTH